MAEFKKVKDHNGTVRYMKDGKFVAGAAVPPDTRETLNSIADNTPVDEDGNLVEEGAGVEGGAPGASDADAEDDATDDDLDETTSDDEPADDGSEPVDDDTDDAVDDENAPADSDTFRPNEDPLPGARPIAPTPADAAKLRQAKARKRTKKEPTYAGQTPQSDPGMGFKRVNGKTVDVFDGKTPHTDVRYVQGVMVPLSRVNALGDPEAKIEPKTDAEIIQQLGKLGMF